MSGYALVICALAPQPSRHQSTAPPASGGCTAHSGNSHRRSTKIILAQQNCGCCSVLNTRINFYIHNSRLTEGGSKGKAATESFRRLEPIVAVRVLDRPARINLRAFSTKRMVSESPHGPSALSVTESVALPPVFVGARAMPEIQKSILPPRQTTRPCCSVCQSRMEIQRIARARAGFEHWTCRCIRCGHIDQVQVHVDPLKSEAQGLQE